MKSFVLISILVLVFTTAAVVSQNKQINSQTTVNDPWVTFKREAYQYIKVKMPANVVEGQFFDVEARSTVTFQSENDSNIDYIKYNWEFYNNDCDKPNVVHKVNKVAFDVVNNAELIRIQRKFKSGCDMYIKVATYVSYLNSSHRSAYSGSINSKISVNNNINTLTGPLTVQASGSQAEYKTNFTQASGFKPLWYAWYPCNVFRNKFLSHPNRTGFTSYWDPVTPQDDCLLTSQSDKRHKSTTIFVKGNVGDVINGSNVTTFNFMTVTDILYSTKRLAAEAI